MEEGDGFGDVPPEGEHQEEDRPADVAPPEDINLGPEVTCLSETLMGAIDQAVIPPPPLLNWSRWQRWRRHYG